MTRLALIAGLLVSLAGAPPPKRKHVNEEGLIPPNNKAQTTPDSKNGKQDPGFSEDRVTETGKDVGQLHGAPDKPGYLAGGDHLGLTKRCDHKIPLDQLFAFPHPESLQTSAEGPTYLFEGKVFQIRSQGGAATPLPYSKVSLFQVSPDGRFLVAISEDAQKSTLQFKGPGAARADVEIAGTVLSARWTPPAGELLLTVGTSDGVRLHRLPNGVTTSTAGEKLPGLAWLTDISPDGRTAVFTVERPEIKSELWLLDLAKNTIKRWSKSQGQMREARFSADSKGLFYIEDGKQGHARLYFAPVKDPSSARLIAGGKTEVMAFTLSPSRLTLAVEASDEGYSKLTGYSLDPKGRTKGQLVAPKLSPGVVETMAFSDDSRLFFVRSSTQEPHEIWMTDQGQSSKWSRFYGGTVPPDCWAGEIAVRYPSFDGKMVPAFLYPSSVPPQKSVAAVFVEGDSEKPFRPGFNPLVRYLVERSVTVLAPNPRGREGYGREWRLLGESSKRADGARDSALAVKWLEKQKKADPDRIGAVGSGYGAWVLHAADEMLPEHFASVALTNPWALTGSGYLAGRPYSERMQQSAELREGVAARRKSESAAPAPQMLFSAAATEGTRLPASEQTVSDFSTPSGRMAHARNIVSFLESKKRKGP